MLDVKPKPRPHTAPAKAWRNYYKVYRVLSILPHGAYFPGLHPGPTAFPSKEIAEQHALSLLGIINPPGRSMIMEYVGAYPEGERAN